MISAAPKLEFFLNYVSARVYIQEIHQRDKGSRDICGSAGPEGTSRYPVAVETRRNRDRTSWIHLLVDGYTELSAIIGKAECVPLEPIS
jgi:hypothetical protein